VSKYKLMSSALQDFRNSTPLKYVQIQRKFIGSRGIVDVLLYTILKYKNLVFIFNIFGRILLKQKSLPQFCERLLYEN